MTGHDMNYEELGTFKSKAVVLGDVWLETEWCKHREAAAGVRILLTETLEPVKS